MKKLALSLALTGALVGISVAGTIDTATVYNKTGINKSTIEQYGSENTQNMGISNPGYISNSNVGNETYINNSTIRQKGYRNYQNMGVNN
jgi:hypothetical protein